jgi:hypothetical protein
MVWYGMVWYVSCLVLLRAGGSNWKLSWPRTRTIQLTEEAREKIMINSTAATTSDPYSKTKKIPSIPYLLSVCRILRLTPSNTVCVTQ